MTAAVIAGTFLVAAVAGAALLMLRADRQHEAGLLEEHDRNLFGALTYTRRANAALAVACLILLAVIFGLVIAIAWISS